MYSLSEFIFVKFKKIFIISILVSTIPLVYIHWFLEDIYRSEVKVLITSEETTRMGGSLTNLAAIAGINLNSGGERSKYTIELFQSRDFLTFFAKKNGFVELIYAAKALNKKTENVIFDSDIYDAKERKWKINDKNGKSFYPSDVQLYNVIMSDFHYSLDKETGAMLLSYEHVSPSFSKLFLDRIISDVNEFVRLRDISKFESSIEYLSAKATETKISDIKNVLNKMLEEQLQHLALAKINKDYAFSIIDKAYLPEEHSKPKRALLSVLTCLVILISVFVFILYFNRKEIVL